ncbi:alpha/beta hydrolase [Paraburkholderia bannensis]|uniref:alpha/beta hydrolase n=1 Tax=Paraburkholderia bannensis TaxID=765414 RepID=UPI002AB6AEDA|nr:alpha/beta hydrolase [Paraburkholderia bannensis]
MEKLSPFESNVLPHGIRSAFVNANGLRVHVLEAGHEVAGRPCVILLHGFPEIAYTWRHNMLALAAAGFHVIAPDQRGYGRTTGSNNHYQCDLHEFGVLNLVSDVLAVLAALGHKSARAIVGHDYGAPVAAHAAMLRPDVFQSVVLMAAPFPGPPEILLDIEDPDPGTDPVLQDLKQLNPPRKHYQWYYASREANEEMSAPSQGLRDFMRAYFHYKSGDYGMNKPMRMQEWSAQELAKLPTYYIMERDKGMSASVAGFMPTPDQIRSCKWLTDEELGVYVDEYARTGFQGGLNWYRCDSHGLNKRQTRLLAGKTIDVPSLFIAGDRDWAVYQKPGFLEAMQSKVCTNLRGSHFIQGAGHWVQQENPVETNKALLEFLA